MNASLPVHPKDQMIAAALALVRARGPAATGFADIIEASGAPRGSIYHHFPAGKAQLLEAAVRRAGEAVSGAILSQGRGASSPGEAVRRVAALFIDPPRASNWSLGCPVAAVAGEGDHQPESVRAAVAETFALWADAVQQVLEAAGVARPASPAFAQAVLAGIEGGLIVARGLRDGAPYAAIVDALAVAADTLGSQVSRDAD